MATPDDRDDLVLGCVTICPPGSPWREISRDDEGEFRMLAVAPAVRGRGVGEALVRMCVDRFRSEGCRGVVVLAPWPRWWLPAASTSDSASSATPRVTGARSTAWT